MSRITIEILLFYAAECDAIGDMRGVEFALEQAAQLDAANGLPVLTWEQGEEVPRCGGT